MKILNKIPKTWWFTMLLHRQLLFIIIKCIFLKKYCTDSLCGLRCSECNVCIYTHICTCLDSVIYLSLCKHIQKVRSMNSGTNCNWWQGKYSRKYCKNRNSANQVICKVSNLAQNGRIERYQNQTKHHGTSYWKSIRWMKY